MLGESGARYPIYASPKFRATVLSMPRVPTLAALALALPAQFGHAQSPPPISDAARELVGAWELSDAERSRRCAVNFSVDRAPGGFRVEFDPECGRAFPPLRDVVAWMLGQNDVLRLIDARRGAVLEFSEVQNGLYEGERPGEGLYFLQTQAASNSHFGI